MENKQDASGNSLYVGNLDGTRVTEQIMIDIFKNGLKHISDKVLGAKMFHPQDGTDSYCFVTFADHDAAMAGMSFLNGREVFNKKVKVNWATSGTSNKSQTGQKYYGACSSIFVGDLDQDIGEEALQKAFEIFGEIVAVRVVRDAVTNSSKGYGFVSFKSKIDAEDAMTKMQGATLGGKAIRTNWATRNKVPGTGGDQQTKPAALNYNEVYQSASSNNTTVYVANLPSSISDEKLRQTFSCFGQIQDTRIFMDKLYCFIKYATHESAATAIVKCNGMDIDGCIIKCWWGKESGENSVPSSGASAGQGQQGGAGGAYSMYNPYHQMYYNYWAAVMAQQQMTSNSQSGQQSNTQAYMPVVQSQGYPMYGMYSAQQYGQMPMMQGYGGSGQQSSNQNGAPSGNYGTQSYQNSH
ncbi:nucleolysin TIAR-like isoform X1 [Rhopilema esculentum]|uniref:nucleolysin TIAR-like isoform X1 n=2 Tax=Rhopilema esculentum TaxID=499914 RepID=UPI0031D1F23A